MRKVAVLLLLVAWAGSVLVPKPPSAQAIWVCSSTAICFARSATMLPIQAEQSDIPRNVCFPLDEPNQVGYIDNNTGTQWRVFTGPSCTGTMGIILSRSEGPMEGVYYRSLDSGYRTSSR